MGQVYSGHQKSDEDMQIDHDNKRQKLGYENIPIGVVSIEEMLSTQYYGNYPGTLFNFFKNH
ncbi:hypothetical protein [Cardinium endosymbiont of Culicoides punctatus]|uniref:hypothetical protein n=1 Tax=Cardinium endosymbiont of Culicoides punctatus TaxID=2304601 RepID=UPI001058FF4B|nr:hypothetical protein [Cardinium endosymbiont of Culicoides punctatus]